MAASGWCRQWCWARSPGYKLRVLSEWQRPVAGDLVKLLTWAYVINRRALAAASEADGLLVRCFPPGPEAAPVTVDCREPHLAPVATCTSGCAQGFPCSLRSLGETWEIPCVRVCTVVIFFLPFAHISAHLENSLLLRPGEVLCLLAFYKNNFFFFSNTLEDNIKEKD